MLLSKSLEGFKLSCLARENSPETIKGHDWSIKTIQNYFNDPEIENIKPKDLQSFFLHLHLESGLSSSSIQKVWTTIRAFHNWAVIELEIDRPDKNIPMPKTDTKEVIPFCEQEILALLKVVEASKRHTAIRDKALILVSLDTGLRVSECARLKIRDVNLENGAVEIKPFRTGLQSNTRIVFLGMKTRKTVWDI